MNPHPQPFAGQGRANPHPHPHPHANANANGRHHGSRHSADYRAPSGSHMNGAAAPNGHGQGSGSGNGHGPMAVPPPRGPNNAGGNGHAQGFGGARSPPTQKNSKLTLWNATIRENHVADKMRITASHVPCKFFRQGTCQAGSACPFLHGELSQPCKYFQKVRVKLHVLVSWVG
jgi:hypothetical protein